MTDMNERLERAIARAVAFIEAYDEYERSLVSLSFRRAMRAAITPDDMNRLRGVAIVADQEKRMSES